MASGAMATRIEEPTTSATAIAAMRRSDRAAEATMAAGSGTMIPFLA